MDKEKYKKINFAWNVFGIIFALLFIAGLITLINVLNYSFSNPKLISNSTLIYFLVIGGNEVMLLFISFGIFSKKIKGNILLKISNFCYTFINGMVLIGNIIVFINDIKENGSDPLIYIVLILSVLVFVVSLISNRIKKVIPFVLIGLYIIFSIFFLILQESDMQYIATDITFVLSLIIFYFVYGLHYLFYSKYDIEQIS